MMAMELVSTLPLSSLATRQQRNQLDQEKAQLERENREDELKILALQRAIEQRRTRVTEITQESVVLKTHERKQLRSEIDEAEKELLRKRDMLRELEESPTEEFGGGVDVGDDEELQLPGFAIPQTPKYGVRQPSVFEAAKQETPLPYAQTSWNTPPAKVTPDMRDSAKLSPVDFSDFSSRDSPFRTQTPPNETVDQPANLEVDNFYPVASKDVANFSTVINHTANISSLDLIDTAKLSIGSKDSGSKDSGSKDSAKLSTESKDSAKLSTESKDSTKLSAESKDSANLSPGALKDSKRSSSLKAPRNFAPFAAFRKSLQTDGSGSPVNEKSEPEHTDPVATEKDGIFLTADAGSKSKNRKSFHGSPSFLDTLQEQQDPADAEIGDLLDTSPATKKIDPSEGHAEDGEEEPEFFSTEYDETSEHESVEDVAVDKKAKKKDSQSPKEEKEPPKEDDEPELFSTEYEEIPENESVAGDDESKSEDAASQATSDKPDKPQKLTTATPTFSRKRIKAPLALFSKSQQEIEIGRKTTEFEYC